MMKKLNVAKLILVSSALLFGLAFAQPIQAQTAPSSAVDAACAGVEAAGGNCDATDSQSSFNTIMAKIINVFSVVVGAVSVLMIIIGGFRYVISGGDSNGIQGAKNTIIYALVGLVIVLFSQIIVRFVLKATTA